MEVIRLLRDRAISYKDKNVIIFKDLTISFSQLNDNVLLLANILSKEGVKKGDKVSIYLPNCPEYVYSYLSVFCLGAVGVPLDFMLKEDELESCLSHSESKILIAVEKPDVALLKLKAAVRSLEKIIVLGAPKEGLLSYGQLLVKAEPKIPDVIIDENDPALIMYTSGTTGKPKGIRLNYKHLDGSPKAMEYFVDLSDKDVKLAALPLSHIGGFIYIQNCLIFGITLVLMERFQPLQFLENIQKYKVTCFHIVPPMYYAVLTLKEIEKFDLSSLRFVVVFGAPSSPEMLMRFHQYCPNAKFLNGWGMTETCPPNTVTPMDSDNIVSVGKPSPFCRIKIVDEQGIEVSKCEIGEIIIDGWVVMDSYYKDPEETARIKKKDGLCTGDLGRFDQNGFLYIIGRKKEMIKVGGQIVYEPEVEAAIYKNENILEAAVIGIPDKLKGEAVKALVVLKNKGVLSAEDLRYFLRQHLANFKVPHEIEIREALPKNRVGKIDKALLREEAAIIK
ncbi:MAG: acyl--CoA ligase [Candidatus Omnitrophica bacterium]|nr:acyl--CoA ligase [Candidatus Omnitrophota bacterium]